MQVVLLLFGQLADIAGTHRLVLQGVSNTDQLQEEVNKLYPAMAGIKCMVAVDKKTVSENTAIHESSVVAMLPPFSGG